MKNLVYDIINPSNNIWLDPSQRLEAGDRILYVSSNESIRLIVDHEASYESCNGCYFGNAILCSVPDRLNCLEYGVIFKLMDTNDMLMTNEFSIELSSIKRSLCNEDTCPYYSDECVNLHSGRDEDYCLIKSILK